MGRGAGAVRPVAAAVLVAIAVSGAVLIRIRPDETVHVARFLATLDHSAGRVGWMIIGAAEIVASLCGVIPASLIAIAAGLIYGTSRGFLVCAPSIMLGAIVGFHLSRSIMRARLAALIGRDRRLRRLDDAVARDGWRLVFLFRLSPIMPFALMSYAFGLTSIDLSSYLLGTCASLPPLLLYTGLGSFARHGIATVSAGDDLLRLAVPAVSILGTVLLFGRLLRLVNRALKDTTEAVGE